MTSDMVLASPSQVTASTELSPEERRELAVELHKDIVQISNTLARAWYEVSELLWPLFALELWREIPREDGEVFASFHEYAEVVVRQPVTTLKNSIYTYHQVKTLGFDPHTLRDIRLSRVQDLAKVLKAYDGNPPRDVWEPLVAAARTAKTRAEVGDYRKLIATNLTRVGVDADDFLRLKGETTQIQMIRDCIALAQDDLRALGFDGVPDTKALEFICAGWAAGRRS